MLIESGLGLNLDLMSLPVTTEMDADCEYFAETPGRYLLEVKRSDLDAIDIVLGDIPFAIIGEFNDTQNLTVATTDVEIDVAELRDAWRGTLDW